MHTSPKIIINAIKLGWGEGLTYPTKISSHFFLLTVSIEASPPPHPNGVNEYGTGLKEIPENHSTSKNAEEQNSSKYFKR